MIPNGKFTITNKSTGEHRTFKINTQAPDAKFAPGKRIAYLLTGSDIDGIFKHAIRLDLLARQAEKRKLKMRRKRGVL